MKPQFKSLTFSTLVLALIVPICTLYWQTTGAQKTIANSFQQSISSTGSNPNSVYGGYEQSSLNSNSNTNFNRQPALVSPGRQRGSSFSSSRQQTSSFSRPAYQPQQQQQDRQVFSSSSYESSQQAEADAEPASYG